MLIALLWLCVYQFVQLCASIIQAHVSDPQNEDFA